MHMVGLMIPCRSVNGQVSVHNNIRSFTFWGLWDVCLFVCLFCPVHVTGITCSLDGEVTKIHLASASSGYLPDSLGNLTTLECIGNRCSARCSARASTNSNWYSFSIICIAFWCSGSLSLFNPNPDSGVRWHPLPQYWSHLYNLKVFWVTYTVLQDGIPDSWYIYIQWCSPLCCALKYHEESFFVFWVGKI